MISSQYPPGFFNLVERVLGKELSDQLPNHDIHENTYKHDDHENTYKNVQLWEKAEAVKGAWIRVNSTKPTPYFAICYTSSQGGVQRVHWDYFTPDNVASLTDLDHWNVKSAENRTHSLLQFRLQPLAKTPQGEQLRNLLKNKVITSLPYGSISEHTITLGNKMRPITLESKTRPIALESKIRRSIGFRDRNVIEHYRLGSSITKQ